MRRFLPLLIAGGLASAGAAAALRGPMGSLEPGQWSVSRSATGSHPVSLCVHDFEALGQWDAYTAARDEMLRRTDSAHAPWMVIRANDKRRGRIAVIQHVLRQLPFAGQDMSAIGEVDKQIVMAAEDFLDLQKTD